MFDFMRKKKDVLSEVSSKAHDQVSLFTPLRRSGGRLISQAQEGTPYFYYVACRPSWSIKGIVPQIPMSLPVALTSPEETRAPTEQLLHPERCTYGPGAYDNLCKNLMRIPGRIA